MHVMALCEHLRVGAYPLIIDCVFDDSLGFTDCLAHCRECGTTYLLEMLDRQGPLRLFRASCPDPDHSARLLRDIERGSCDLSRMGAESELFRLINAHITDLLLLDTAIPRVIATVPAQMDLPRRSWRELPCDGAWISRVQALAARS